MLKQPYRTGVTSLTDDQLVLLDALFDKGVSPKMLRKNGFLEQLNLGYAHSLDDSDLERSIEDLCEAGFLEPFLFSSTKGIRMTPRGGELWSQERCPAWDRYCTESYRTTLRGRTMMSVVAVTAGVRDHFLDRWPEGPARRKKATLTDQPQLIGWHPFWQVFAGVAIYDETPPPIPSSDPEENNRRFQLTGEGHTERWSILERERTWWRCVRELQKFVA